MLLVPAAGIGSRLKSDVPKFMAPVLGRPMIDWLVDLCRPWVTRMTVVVHPRFADAARARSWPAALTTTVATQSSPTGMLDALLAATPDVQSSDAARIWVLWCDQIALLPSTMARLAALDAEHRDAPLVMPTCTRPAPYIHFDRDDSGRISAVRQRREGDAMPEIGESDAGCFSFSRQAFLEWLPQYSVSVALGAGTGERNLLPFIPWVAQRGAAVTFGGLADIETVGVNTPEELLVVEQALAQRIS